jgi:hypothetical protein
MRMCADHWGMLRAAVDATGLGTLVSEDGEEAMKKMVTGMQEGPTIDNFDPLVQAHNALLSNVMKLCMENGGQNSVAELMGLSPPGEWCQWCPLCYINEQHEQACEDPDCTFTFDDWCTRAAQEQLTAWKELAS